MRSVIRWMAAQPANVDDSAFAQARALLDRVERRDIYVSVFETLFRNERVRRSLDRVWLR